MFLLNRSAAAVQSCICWLQSQNKFFAFYSHQSCRANASMGLGAGSGGPAAELNCTCSCSEVNSPDRGVSQTGKQQLRADLVCSRDAKEERWKPPLQVWGSRLWLKNKPKKNNSFEGGRFFFFFPSLQGKTICVLKFNSCKCGFFFFFSPLCKCCGGVIRGQSHC